MADLLEVQWIHGSLDCATNADAPVQVHAFDDETYILRENKCVNFEGPFLYLLFGTEKALLLDTGAEPGPSQHLPLRTVVQGIVSHWLTKHQRPSIELLVAHSHSHEDHSFGDGQFAGQPQTTVVPPSLTGVCNFFGLTDWPNQSVVFDLGDRPLTVIPVPGHDPTHIAVYDPKTRVLFSGDMFYPGFLYVRDWTAYRHSIDRLAQFNVDHPITYFLGAHIEMTRTKKVPYPPGTKYQPEEHVLQLLPQHFAELRAALESLGNEPTRKVLDDFIIEPLV
jgi:hydroxyacylglutathione hydrolase